MGVPYKALIKGFPPGNLYEVSILNFEFMSAFKELDSKSSHAHGSKFHYKAKVTCRYHSISAMST